VSRQELVISRIRQLWKGVPCYRTEPHPVSGTVAVRIGDPPGAQLTIWFDRDGEKIAYATVPRVMS
jgi:hypothetical protein